MAESSDQTKYKLVDYNALKRYDALLKEWFKSQLVYATEQDITNLFETQEQQ